jgi:hypothetical protein
VKKRKNQSRAEYLRRFYERGYVGTNPEEDSELEHSCHAHPLGSTEVITYWCGHTCREALCRRYKFVWMLTHPAQVIAHLLGYRIGYFRTLQMPVRDKNGTLVFRYKRTFWRHR